MLKYALIAGAVVVVAVGVVLVLAAAKPDTFVVTRAATIKAAPDRIFAYLDDFRRFGKWSPYETLDPSMSRSYSGPNQGTGASYAWDSNGQAGTGSMKITDVSAPNRVLIDLDFSKPFEAHNKVTFSLKPEGDATRVEWDMRGPTPFFGKIIHVFFDMDTMVGKDFETGLATLKSLCESPAT